MAGFNWYVDLYGIFRGKPDRTIYADERTSKYLLAYRYVPENFDGYIIGPSLSANIDPKIQVGHRIYNLSMMGANITEQAAVVRKAMEHKTPKLVIICLHPYLTLDHGMKTGMINEREYYGALGSVSLYKAYTLWAIRKLNLAPERYPQNQFNDFGYNDYGVTLVTMSAEDKIAEQLTREDAIKAEIDPVAMEEFKSLIKDLTDKNVQIVAYFHPLPYPLYNKFREPLKQYQNTMAQLLPDSSVLIDFNKDEKFTKDVSNYIDHGHLSYKGQDIIFSQIVKEIPR